MLKRHESLFANLFANKVAVEDKKTVPVVVTSYSQPHVLQQRMNENKLTHDQTVMANLSPVRLESNFGKMVMYFCPMVDMQILSELNPGDGGALPAEAILDGIEVPGTFKPGLYNLNNVKLHSNGRMQVIATDETTFEQFVELRPEAVHAFNPNIPF